MKIHKFYLTLVLFSTIGTFSTAQSRLELNNDILYSNTITSQSDSIYLKISLLNNSNKIVNDFSISAILDSNGIELYKSGATKMLVPQESFDTFLIFSPKALAPFDTLTTFEITALTRTAGVSQASQNVTLQFKTLPKETPFLTIFQDTPKDTFFFNENYPLRVSLRNKGLVDFFNFAPIELMYQVNDNPPVSFFSSTQALLAGQKNRIYSEDSILISDTYFKKGGGNIVVVWPVGFSKVDSFYDSFYVGWPSNITSKIAKRNLILYPNPASNKININLNSLDIERVRIYNMQGKLIEELKPTKTLDVSHLKKGSYLIQIDCKSQTLQQALLIQ